MFVSVLSVISLIQHFFNVGIAEVFSDFLSYYRQLVYQFFGFFGQLFSIQFPEKMMDLWALSFVGAGAYVRTPNIEYNRLFRDRDIWLFPRYWKGLLFVFMGLSFIGLAILLAVFQPQTYVDELSIEPQNLMRGTIINALIVLSGVLVFFSLNAYAPSI